MIGIFAPLDELAFVASLLRDAKVFLASLELLEHSSRVLQRWNSYLGDVWEEIICMNNVYQSLLLGCDAETKLLFPLKIFNS